MRKNRFSFLLSVVLVFVLLASLTFNSCALQDVPPIFEEEAAAIQTALDPLLAAKAEALDTAANEYEVSGEIIKDENGNDVDMTSYIARLRANASILRTLTYEPYALAIMDDLYARKYIGVYRSVISMLPTMVDLLASVFLLDELTDESVTTEALLVAYTLSLEDIYASYVDNETAKEESEMPTSYVGIGVSVTPREDGYINVISVTRGSPAEGGGILPGDILIAVEGDDISDIDYNDVVNLVKGEVDTTVTLTFKRGNENYTVTLTRRIVENVTVEHKMLSIGGGTTGYIRISEFSTGTFNEFVTAVEALEAAGATEFVFDVRNNPGGNAEVVIAILEYLLPDDITHPIVRFDSREGSTDFHSVEEYLRSYGASETAIAKFAAAKDHELNARMAVLCNEYTASAGELFTSCLMDFGVAETYGTTTYGKGLGQSSYRVTDYYACVEFDYPYYYYSEMGYFVIPAFYYSPPISDNYHDVGVVPHHAVELSEEAKQYHVLMIPEHLDTQLVAAVSFVTGDTPLTPPPSIENGDGSTEQPPAAPPTGEAQENFFVSNVFLFTVFGVLFVTASVLTVYLVVDYRHNAKRKSEESDSENNPENDN